MGTMLDQAELRGMEKGRTEQRKLDEAELKKQADTIATQAARIAELEAQLAKK